jgi:tensin
LLKNKFFFRCFGFVSKNTNGTKSSQPENECHIFAEVDSSQPSSAIVNFVSKVMIGSVPV